MTGESNPTPSVYVLGPTDASSAGLAACLKHLKLQIRYFSQAAEFLSEALNKPSDCLVIDLDGSFQATEIQTQLTRHGCRSVVIAIATDLDVDMAIEVMEHGALTLLRKPLQPEICELYMQRALYLARDENELRSAYVNFVEQQAGLSTRQRDILWSVLAGQPSKAIAAKLDVSNRLVELERSRLLKIFQSDSTTELAFKVGEFLTLQRTLAHSYPPNFSRLRIPVERDTPRTPDEG